MQPDHLTQLIIDYRYWIVIPLSFLEGPVIAFAVGTLSSFGYFNPFVAVWVFFAKDMIMDGVFYFLGRFATRAAFVQRLLRKGGLITESTDEFKKQWDGHAFRTMFMAKLPHGFSSIFLAMSGVIRAPMARFFAYAAIIAVMQYVLLFVLGYYFGSWLGVSSSVVTRVQYVLTGVFTLAAVYLAAAWFIRRRIKKRGGL
jgi:membrane protein DedA with SNARE-associated domain